MSLRGQDYEQVDATIELYPSSFTTAEELSRLISRDFTSEEHKVRAIYTWIIRNVAYEPEEYKQFNFNFKNYRERNTKEEKTRQKVIQRTIDKGIAVCEGYAMLFERLCELQGISNYLVRGDIKTNFNDIGRPFKKLHMWNVAVIDGNPYLFDPTWGAGKYNDRFIKEPTYFYYKTPPELFAKTHYPHMAEDTFLEREFSREDFAALPLLIEEGLRIQDVISPMQGVISSLDEDGQIDFKIRSRQVERITYSFGSEKKTVAFLRQDGFLEFHIPLKLGSRQLLIYFDGKPAMGYKIE
ncbi:MAG: transglutaminase-like domain-containing protein [Bacteroidota bacterium]